MQVYETSGLRVSSDVALPGMSAAPASPAPDLFIRQGLVPSRLEEVSAEGPTWQMAGDRFLLRVPGVARFLLTGGSVIEFEEEPDADAGDIPAFLAGTVLGIALHQRGHIVLHASAVALNGKAIRLPMPSSANVECR